MDLVNQPFHLDDNDGGLEIRRKVYRPYAISYVFDRNRCILWVTLWVAEQITQFCVIWPVILITTQICVCSSWAIHYCRLCPSLGRAVGLALTDGDSEYGHKQGTDDFSMERLVET